MRIIINNLAWNIFAARKSLILRAISLRNIAIVFAAGWIATLIPAWVYHFPSLWAWGYISAILLCAAGLSGHYSHKRRFTTLPLIYCASLISLATLLDSWLLAPDLILSQCRSGTNKLSILEHMTAHVQWFPITTLSMIGFIWMHNIKPDSRTWYLSNIGRSMLMLFLMGVAMSGLESLARAMQKPMSIDAMVSGMVSGMALYHITLNMAPAVIISVRVAVKNFIRLSE